MEDFVFDISAGGVDHIASGSYTGVFEGLEKFTSQKGVELLRWKWKLEDGRVVSGVTNPEKPTIKNKLGKYLCFLAKRPLSVGTVEVKQYIGKKYLLMVSETDKGSEITAFSLMA